MKPLGTQRLRNRETGPSFDPAFQSLLSQEMLQKHPDPSGDLTPESPRPFGVLHVRYLQCLPSALGYYDVP